METRCHNRSSYIAIAVNNVVVAVWQVVQAGRCSMKSKQMLFKNWRPEMGLPSVKPEYWSNAEWAKAVALRPERYATPRWVDVLVGAITLGAAGAEGVKAAWDTFREGYESAYANAKRAS